eukprot:1036873-Pyramimonas_sp.AAC.1
MIVKSRAALVLMVCQMCSAFSRLQNLNNGRMTEDRIRELLEEGMILKFAMELFLIERANGLYFLFEHPASASSWSTKCAQRLLKYLEVDACESDLSCFDFSQLYNGEGMRIKKPTRFMTNSPEIGGSLAMKCDGSHCRMELIGGGRTRRAQICPDNLCKEIVSGLMRQMSADKRYMGSHSEEAGVNEVQWNNGASSQDVTE